MSRTRVKRQYAIQVQDKDDRQLWLDFKTTRPITGKADAAKYAKSATDLPAGANLRVIAVLDAFQTQSVATTKTVLVRPGTPAAELADKAEANKPA